MFAVAKHEVADAVPSGRERMALEAGEWRHSQIEPSVTLCPAPQHEFDEHVVHRAARRVCAKTHKIDGQLLFGAREP